MTGDESDRARGTRDECDVVVVGGGPAGCAAGVFTARYGLETLVFDRGTGSLDRCAFLGNYLGFPGGIDVETFQGLCRDHAREAGCRVVDDLVETVEGADGDRRFAVATQDGRRLAADRVVAATRYDGSYLRPVVGDDAFQSVEHDGESREQFDRDYPDTDGRTPVEGLYVASPSGERDVQAVVAAGQGAHVARSLVEDHRSEIGLPGQMARHYDWLRPETEFEGEWGDRDRWREYFHSEVPDDTDLSDERLAELREAYVDRAFGTRRSADEMETATERAHRQLAQALDPDAVLETLDSDAVLEALDPDAVLDTIDDETIRAYLAATEPTTE